MLWQPPCALCDVPPGPLCDACARQLTPASRPAPVAGLDDVLALIAYEGAGRRLVHRWKFDGFDPVLRAIAPPLAGMLLAHDVTPDAITWVPTDPASRRVRGRDHASALAAALSSAAGVPRRALLTRPPGAPQTGRSRAERLVGPRLAPLAPSPAAVVLVDDVITTGATMVAAAAALRAGGARRVVGVAIARTPRNGSQGSFDTDELPGRREPAVRR